jgi:hypothetical protein
MKTARAKLFPERRQSGGPAPEGVPVHWPPPEAAAHPGPARPVCLMPRYMLDTDTPADHHVRGDRRGGLLRHPADPSAARPTTAQQQADALVLRTRIRPASPSSRMGRTFPQKRRGAWMMRTRRVLLGLSERSSREATRLISARTVTRRERRGYEEGKSWRDSAG